MALAPFFVLGEPAFAPSPRELRRLNKGFDWTSALMPAFDQLPVQAAASTAMELVESDDAFTVMADAPGFDPKDVNISLKDGVITISGRKDNDKKQERDGKVVRRERTSVSFSRSFGLPDNVRQDDISASLDKGVLTVTLPKQEPTAKPQPRRIAVQPAAAAANAAAAAAADAPAEEAQAQPE